MKAERPQYSLPFIWLKTSTWVWGAGETEGKKYTRKHLEKLGGGGKGSSLTEKEMGSQREWEVVRGWE